MYEYWLDPPEEKDYSLEDEIWFDKSDQNYDEMKEDGII